jgi:hypothetical protein
MDNLAFDPHGALIHALTCTTLSNIYTKKNLYLLNSLQPKNFNVGAIVKEVTNKLEINAKYKLCLPILKEF